MKKLKQYLVYALTTGFFLSPLACSNPMKDLKPGVRAKVGYERPFPIHLGKESITDFKEQIEIGEKHVKIQYPAAGDIIHLSVMYADVDKDSNVDWYDVSYAYNGYEPNLANKYNKQYAEKYPFLIYSLEGEVIGEIIDDELQTKINQEYKQLREQHEPLASIHLDKFEKTEASIESQKDLIRIRYPPPYPMYQLEIMYADLLTDSNVDIYKVTLHSRVHGEIILTNLYSQQYADNHKGDYTVMDDILQKEINKEYESLKESQKQNLKNWGLKENEKNKNFRKLFGKTERNWY